MTPCQQKVLAFIQLYSAAHGYAPSFREMRDGMGYASTSSLFKCIDELIVLGKLRKVARGSRRNIHLVNELGNFSTEALVGELEKRGLCLYFALSEAQA